MHIWFSHHARRANYSQLRKDRLVTYNQRISGRVPDCLVKYNQQPHKEAEKVVGCVQGRKWALFQDAYSVDSLTKVNDQIVQSY